MASVSLGKSGSDVNPLRNRRRSDMALLLKYGGIIVRNRGMTLTVFYQQISRRLRHQFGRGKVPHRSGI